MAEGPHNLPDEALLDLLVKQVAEGLSPEEERALEAMDSASTSALARDIERAAAAVTLAGTSSREPLPAAVAQRIAAQASAHFAAAASQPRTVADLSAAREARRVVPSAAATSARYGWFAAAACLVLALIGWLRPQPSALPVEVDQVARESGSPAPRADTQAPSVMDKSSLAAAAPAPAAPAPEAKAENPATERAAMLASADTVKVTFGATKDAAAAGVSGDVVWDQASQRGYVRLTGLAANDPALKQYQMWIFDAKRDKRYPVDAGVFDAPNAAGELILPIHGALPVLKPAAFAVTLEKAGGVVVSGREHVIVLGAVG